MTSCGQSPIPPKLPPKPVDAALETKIAQLLLVGFRGFDRTDTAGIMDDIADRSLGGVVLFDIDGPSGQPQRNIVSSEQVQALTRDLQAAGSQASAAVVDGGTPPLLIAADQEGGQVRRFKERHGFPVASSARKLGRSNDLNATFEEATTMARSLAACGVNLNLAPVVDLDTNPANPVIGQKQRSYSEDPDIVTAHAAAFIQAHRQEGLCCALKHFPGHGSCDTDTHAGFTDVTQTWNEMELRPFEQLIQDDLAAAVMTAHVFNAQLDAQWPATLSYATITGLLRRRLKFDGVVISDDLGMGAIAGRYGRRQALELALLAGVDVLCLCNQTTYEEDLVERTIEDIGSIVASGSVKEERIDEAFARVLRLKDSLRCPE
jgi:beta-N-acetylhexosaminidase